MASIQDIENEIVEEFSLFDDQMDRYDYIIDLGKKLPAFPEDFRTDDFLVKGCQSSVWLHAFLKDGKLFFDADSNTAITKGIISLLVRIYSGQTPQDILATEPTFIEKINLRSHLSSQRSNGLNAMLQKMKWYAEIYKV
ncbi:MAG TPA: SufE family protein [Chitinophagales bacterium]